ncbi:MAG TPA: crosslink repair DNA glycosylase YcaQ family protein [Thermoanaerobaculia bacterium]|nr:crosslink repair DNA glycosylase YcaQ family protein [Thermoanaerobaculia bacterium]
MSEAISLRAARRLALARAGLLFSPLCGLPTSAGRGEAAARRAAHAVVGRFGYLQLDTVSVAGARSHAIVLLSRLRGFPPRLAEELLQPGEPLFEYWGHEASWIPLELYPAFGFRREELRVHPWWGDLLGEHRHLADELLRRIEAEGPLRSLDMEGEGGKGWWQLKVTKKVATALWSAGELAIRERRAFQRTFDLTERVIPERWRREAIDRAESLRRLLLVALGGHGWATTGTLAATWRLRNKREEIAGALRELVDAAEIVPCTLVVDPRKARGNVRGWCRPADLELAATLERARPRADQPVLLSPFDPLLWDRGRVQLLFGFGQSLEIFKPAAQRVFGYYVLPVLAGERLVGRVDLKARPAARRLDLLAAHHETDDAATREAVQAALQRYADAVGLSLSR